MKKSKRECLVIHSNGEIVISNDVIDIDLDVNRLDPAQLAFAQKVISLQAKFSNERFCVWGWWDKKGKMIRLETHFAELVKHKNWWKALFLFMKRTKLRIEVVREGPCPMLLTDAKGCEYNGPDHWKKERQVAYWSAITNMTDTQILRRRKEIERDTELIWLRHGVTLL